MRSGCQPYTRWLVKSAVYAAISYVTIRRYVGWGFEASATISRLFPTRWRRKKLLCEEDVPVHRARTQPSRLQESNLKIAHRIGTRKRESAGSDDLSRACTCYCQNRTSHLTLMEYLIKSTFETRDIGNPTYRCLRRTLLRERA